MDPLARLVHRAIAWLDAHPWTVPVSLLVLWLLMAVGWAAWNAWGRP